MISATIKIIQIYTNEGSDTCVKGKIVTIDDNRYLQTHPQYKTVSVYGNFPDACNQYDKYIVTLSDHPSDKGHYRLILMGRLPHKETLKNLKLLVQENIDDKWSYDEYRDILDAIDDLSSEEYKCILKALKESNKFTPNDKEKKILSDNKSLINELKSIYRRASNIANLRKGLEESLNITDPNIHYKIVSNLKGDYKDIIKSLKDNPYLLIDKAEMRLGLVDEIALSVGVKADDDNRIAAITEMNLRTLGEEGKTWVTKELYVNIADELYSYDTSNYSFSKSYLREKIDFLGDRVGFYMNVDNDRIASSKYYLMEQELFKIIKSLSTTNSLKVSLDKVKGAISSCEKMNNIQLLSEQRLAVSKSFQNDFSVIAGAAGTGKTTIAKAVANAYSDVVVSALSGKATLRISETTGIEGERARTMHSFAGMDKKYIGADLIILDEASMVGLDIAISFFKKVRPGTHILVLGDHCQLSPIGAGNMFYDLIHSNFINVSIIKEVHRQALDSTIIRFATDVRQQIYNVDSLIENNHDDFELYLLNNNNEISNKAVDVFKKGIEEYKVEDIMLVSPTKKMCYVLNNTIQKILAKEYKVGSEIVELCTPWDQKLRFKLRVGDRIINIENYHKCPSNSEGEHVAIMNGSLGTFKGEKSLKNKEGKIRKVYEFDFDGIGLAWYSRSELKRILLGYAITVHKSQGSQSKLLIYTHPEKCHERLNCSEMVYTAVTRARDKAVVISTNGALEPAVLTKELNSKQTLLREFLDNSTTSKSSKALKDFADKYKPKKQENTDVVTTNHDDKVVKSKKKKQQSKEKFPKVASKKVISDEKLRDRYDKNNVRRKLSRRNEDFLNEREQAKVDNILKVQNLSKDGLKNKDICDSTGFTKGTVSKYLKINIDDYIKQQIEKANIKSKK